MGVSWSSLRLRVSDSSLEIQASVVIIGFASQSVTSASKSISSDCFLYCKVLKLRNAKVKVKVKGSGGVDMSAGVAC